MSLSSMGYDSRMIRSPFIGKSGFKYNVRDAVLGLDLMINPVTDIVFSSTDGDTVEWTAGTIYFADGSSSGTLVASDTGNIAATTFIYFDRNRPGVLLTTTDAKVVSGVSRVLVAVVSSGDANCTILPMMGSGLGV